VFYLAAAVGVRVGLEEILFRVIAHAPEGLLVHSV
jgi:hypothetical protein